MAEKDWVEDGLSRHKCSWGGDECKQFAERKLRVGENCGSLFCEKHLLATLKELPLALQLEHINRMADAQLETGIATEAALKRVGGKSMDATMYDLFINDRLLFWKLRDVTRGGEKVGEITIVKGFVDPLVVYLQKKGYKLPNGKQSWQNLMRKNFDWVPSDDMCKSSPTLNGSIRTVLMDDWYDKEVTFYSKKFTRENPTFGQSEKSKAASNATRAKKKAEKEAADAGGGKKRTRRRSGEKTKEQLFGKKKGKENEQPSGKTSGLSFDDSSSSEDELDDSSSSEDEDVSYVPRRGKGKHFMALSEKQDENEEWDD
jgi:hypothetical protein